MTPRSTRLHALAMTALLAAVSGCLFDTDPPNDLPVIDTVSAEPSRVAPDSASVLTVVAHDPEGVPLDYRWQASAGLFDSGSYTSTAQWRAPASTGPCTLTVTVDDGRDSVAGTLVVTVTEHANSPHITAHVPTQGFALVETRLPVYVTNDGGAPAEWTAAFDAAWATPDPAAGTLAVGASDTILLDADRSVVPPGLASGNLGIQTADGGLMIPFTLLQPWTYEVIARYPHDDDAFTQGLVWHDGSLYEGTGRYNRSKLREVALATGEVLREIDLEGHYFGEGITIWQERVIQLTYREHTAFVWSVDDFAPLGTFAYPDLDEGWGLTHDGTRLIMSDGSSTLYFRDPDTFAETGRVTVEAWETEVENLNELEWIDGAVWANLWLTDLVVRIDPASGQVTDVVDFSGLLTPAEAAPANVLNGIAHDPDTGRTWVTGKLWPWLFEIELVDPSAD